jgi:thioredoxin-like negative regulator of GroEL
MIRLRQHIAIIRGSEVRQAIVGLLEVLGEEDPLTRQYRTELAAILF